MFFHITEAQVSNRRTHVTITTNYDGGTLDKIFAAMTDTGTAPAKPGYVRVRTEDACMYGTAPKTSLVEGEPPPFIVGPYSPSGDYLILYVPPTHAGWKSRSGFSELRVTSAWSRMHPHLRVEGWLTSRALYALNKAARKIGIDPIDPDGVMTKFTKDLFEHLADPEDWVVKIQIDDPDFWMRYIDDLGRIFDEGAAVFLEHDAEGYHLNGETIGEDRARDLLVATWDKVPFDPRSWKAGYEAGKAEATSQT